MNTIGKIIDSNYDEVLAVNYDLCAIRLSELKSLAKEWYKDFDLDSYDIRNDYLLDGKVRDEASIVEMKLTGLAVNYFYVYVEDGEYYLLDGYNRLFTKYASLGVDPIVYVRVITDKCTDNKLMSIMFRLNMWKLNKHRIYQLETDTFFDRGFRLFLNKKFNILLDASSDYNTKVRAESDFRVLDRYFRDEVDYSDSFSYDYENLFKLFSNENIINDFKDFIRANDYMEKPFSNYNYFLNGYIMFVSWRRVIDDNSEYKFDNFLEMLKNDKFYKKLIGMSYTDSTRKNVFKFFRDYIRNERERNSIKA